MTDNEDDKTISVAGKKTLSLKPSGVQQGTVRQDMGRGRTKAVVVETRTKRHFSRPGEDRQASAPVTPVQRQPEPQQTRPAPQQSRPVQQQPSRSAEQSRPRVGVVLNQLSPDEVEARRRALAEAQIRDAAEARQRAEDEARRKVEEEARRKAEEEARIQREKEEAERRANEAAAPAPEPEAEGEQPKRRRGWWAR